MTSLAPPLAAPAPRTLLGISLMLAGFFCYSISDAAAKRLTEVLPPLEVVWFRQLGLLTVAAWLVIRLGLPVFSSRRPVLQMTRGVAAAMSSTLFIIAVAYVPLADAVAVSFVAPFVVTVLAALVLREAVGWRRWLAILVGFTGMLLVVRPGSGVFQPQMLLVVAAATLFAFRQVISRVLGPLDSTATTIVYTGGMGTLALTVPMLLVWQTPDGAGTWLMLALVAASAGLGEVLVIRALELAQAVVLAPLQYSLIIWSTLFGWFLFAQLPDSWTLAGAAIIVASGIYTVHRERLASRRRA
jgi:drug/metabolite transporter (DMT)-like permease